jgi:hypothetical protein
MVKKKAISIKHLQIDKANKSVLASTAIAIAVIIFGIFVARAVVLRYNHQEKVISAKETALEQLKSNVTAKDQMVEAYKNFIEGEEGKNIIGGSKEDNVNNNDGDNGRIILDALPSKYDFPGLATSINKLFSGSGYDVEAIDGVDDEINQLSQESEATPTPIEISLSVEIANSNYEGIQNAVKLLERSIRPFKVKNLHVNGSGNSMSVTFDLVTYYQPAKIFKIQKQVIQ